MCIMTPMINRILLHNLLWVLALWFFPSKVCGEGKPSFQEILKTYNFIGDFSLKEEERDLIPTELFWHYPFHFPKVTFPIEEVMGDRPEELPATPGGSRVLEHMNRGRILFLEKKYAEAKSTWLSGRFRFGKDYPYHRRNDYFLSLAFLKLAFQVLHSFHEDWSNLEVKVAFANAATFFSWAFLAKADIPDPLVDQETPQGLYNLAAIYYLYDRFSGSHGAAQAGLDFLRKTGRSEYRPQFHRMVAESWIRNHDYLQAVQELDTMIRQDPDPLQAALAFGRVADIYFDLNNYELAEDTYGWEDKTFATLEKLSPKSAILRGESLFWMGRFEDAQKSFWLGLNSQLTPRAIAPLPEGFEPWANLRIADAFLARYKLTQDEQLLEKARLAYFHTSHNYPQTEAAQIADIRRACLELPLYSGQNVHHGRQVLEQAAQKPLPPQVMELALACHVSSYTQRERGQEMMQKVRGFLGTYPQSRFLNQFVTPLREERASEFEKLLKQRKDLEGIQFYETFGTSVLPTLTPWQEQGLFRAYMRTLQGDKASPFWPAFMAQEASWSEEDLQLAAIYLAEAKGAPPWDSLPENLKTHLREIQWPVPLTPQAALAIARILRGERWMEHTPELLSYGLAAAKSDPKTLCQEGYPILSRLASSIPNQVDEGVHALIEERFPGFLQEGPLECALGLLDLEARVAPDKTSDRWLTRLSWPMSLPLAERLWNVSEELKAKGRENDAKKIWLYLQEQGPADSKIAPWVKLRLDPFRTETEKLWQ